MHLTNISLMIFVSDGLLNIFYINPIFQYSIIPVLKVLFRQLLKDEMKDENDHTDGYGAVRNIKGRPVKIADIEIQKIHHLPHSDPVNQISQRPANDKRKPG